MDNHVMEIHVNGRSYLVKPLEQETEKVLSTRLWFIIKQNPESDIDFQEAEKWSILWYYMTYYKCRYGSQLEARVNELAKNLYI